ncbi:MAG: FAD-dependent oxidoreductase [Clostridiales bacterium]|jgi:flavocytochrome c|nr:FAD-dependent oxidoreductase [Clostridiales bacterium]
MKPLKIITVLLCALLAFTACAQPAKEPVAETTPAPAPEPQPPVEQQTLVSGTYQGEATGHNGKVVVSVTVDDGAITDVAVVESAESFTVGDVAFEKVKGQILEYQTLNVDTITGATVSRAAFLQAISTALETAGADVAALKAVEIPNDATPGALDWNTDVVVIGSGVAGLGAALQAADNGAKVILLEKRYVIGGTSAVSAGWFHAGGTEIQAKLGIEDSPDKFFEDWMALARLSEDANINETIVRYIADSAPLNIEWLIDHNIAFDDTVFEANAYDPHRNIPRIHATSGGKGHIAAGMQKAAEAAGVEIHRETPAIELIKEGNAIVGVKAKDKVGNDITIRAKAIVLACGSFTANPELMAKYYPTFTDYKNSNVSDGDGILMAEAAGAEIVVKDSLQSYPDSSLGHGYFTPSGLFVTPDGERFVNESTYFYTRQRVLNQMGTYEANLVLTQELYEKQKDGVEALIETGRAYKADTVAALAQMMGMKPDVLEKTIARYNELCDAGEDKDFNKAPEFMQKIEAPYVGLDLYGNINDAYTGVRINEHAQVFANDGTIIDGLYACGGLATPAVLPQEYLGSGSALMQGLAMGRAAANHIAALAK